MYSTIPEMLSKMRGFIGTLREMESEEPLNERDKELLEGLKKLTTRYMSEAMMTIVGNCKMCCAPIEFRFTEIVRSVPGDSNYTTTDGPVKCNGCGATNVVSLSVWLAIQDGGYVERIKARTRLKY